MPEWKCNRCNHTNTSNYRCSGCGVHTKFFNPKLSKYAKAKTKKYGTKLTLNPSG